VRLSLGGKKESMKIEMEIKLYRNGRNCLPPPAEFENSLLLVGDWLLNGMCEWPASLF
jgi:hypothetical protein